MAMLPNVFKAEDNRGAGFEPLPPGWYVGCVVKSAMKETKAGNGNKYLELQFKITEGQYAGRMVFERLNLVNSNPTAVEIANNKLAALCDAADLGEVEDSVDLHGIDVGIKLAVREGTGAYAPSNEIKSYKPASEVEVDEDTF